VRANGEREECRRAACDLRKPFGPVVELASLNEPNIRSVNLSLTGAERTAFFCLIRTIDSGLDQTTWTASRAQTDQPFGAPILVNGINFGGAGASACDPSISDDGLTLFLASTGGVSNVPPDLYSTTRSTTASDFGAPVKLANLNAPQDDLAPHVSSDGLEIFFTSDRSSGFHIYRATRADTTSAFSPPQIVTEITSSAQELASVVTRDGLRIFFSSTRTDGGAKGGRDVWTATRTAPGQPFTNLQPVAEINSSQDEFPTWISPDGCRLYVTAGTLPNWRFYVTSKP
jgi:hypothetical protein